MEKGIQIAVIICATILILGLVGMSMFYSVVPDQLKGKTVTVYGNSLIKANPDLLKIYFNMETNASTSSEATSLNAKQVDDMTTALIKLGLERKQIQTQNFAVYPWDVWENDKNVNKGYKVTHQIVVELESDQFDLAGRVIDAGTDSEAEINYINFELSTEKQNEYKAQALKEASQDARVQAQAMADGLNKKLGDIVSVTNQDYYYEPWRYYDYAVASSASENVKLAKQAVTNIQPSDKDITARVSVIYSLR